MIMEKVGAKIVTRAGIMMFAAALLSGCCQIGTRGVDKLPDGVECLERVDRAMAEGDESSAISWYHDAAKLGVGLAETRLLLANRASAAYFEAPSPAVIDNLIYRALCSEKIIGTAEEAYNRLVERYSAKEPFSIAEAVKMSREECRRFACELAVVGCQEAILYLRKRELIDFDDTDKGGLVHYAAIAGQELCVQWLVGVCCADAHKVEEKGATPVVWVMREMRYLDEYEDLCAEEMEFREKLQRIKTYLITFERPSDDED